MLERVYLLCLLIRRWTMEDLEQRRGYRETEWERKQSGEKVKEGKQFLFICFSGFWFVVRPKWLRSPIWPLLITSLNPTTPFLDFRLIFGTTIHLKAQLTPLCIHYPLSCLFNFVLIIFSIIFFMFMFILFSNWYQ